VSAAPAILAALDKRLDGMTAAELDAALPDLGVAELLDVLGRLASAGLVGLDDEQARIVRTKRGRA
jgi:hypothetical protein